MISIMEFSEEIVVFILGQIIGWAKTHILQSKVPNIAIAHPAPPITISLIEKLISNPGFHCLAEKILTYLDLWSMAKCRLVSKQLRNFIDCQKTLMVLQIEQVMFIRTSRQVWFRKAEIEETLQSNTLFGKIFNKKWHVNDLKQVLAFMKGYFSFPMAWTYSFYQYFSSMNILEFICYHNHSDILEIILRNVEPDYLKTLLSKPKIISKDETILHLACRNGSIEIVTLLIQVPKIDFNIKDGYGFTPLHHASSYGQDKMVEFLLMEHFFSKIPMDIHARDNIERTPLHLACWNYYGENVKVLQTFLELSDMVDFKAEDIGGWTPFHYSCRSGYYNVTKLILDYCLRFDNIIDINSPSVESETPLHLACEFGHDDVVELLIEHHKKKENVDFNAQNTNGNTPLHLACEKGHIKVVCILMNFHQEFKDQIDINLTNDAGKIPMDLLDVA